MSWLSQFAHNPGQFITHNPWKAAALLGAPLAAIAAPFALGGLAGAGAGLFGAEAGAAGLAGAEGAGLAAAEGGLAAGGAGALEGGGSLAALLESAGPEAASAFAEGGGAVSEFAGSPMAFEGAFEPFGMGSGFSPSAFAGEAGGGIAGDFGGTFSAATGAEIGAGGEAAPFGLVGEESLGGGFSNLAATGGAVPGGAGAGAEGGLSGLLGKAGGWIGANPLKAAGIGVAGAGLGYNMLAGQQQSPEMKALAAQSAQLGEQQKQLMSYLQQGTLPPGLKAGVDQATSAMKARIIANHAKNGMPTDPSQNSALAQELNSVDMNAMALIAQQGVALLNSGLQAAGMSSQLYAMLEKMNRDQAASTGRAIASFAAALSGGPQINIQRAA